MRVMPVGSETLAGGSCIELCVFLDTPSICPIAARLSPLRRNVRNVEPDQKFSDGLFAAYADGTKRLGRYMCPTTQRVPAKEWIVPDVGVALPSGEDTEAPQLRVIPRASAAGISSKILGAVRSPACPVR
jgi:hypothetical protein